MADAKAGDARGGICLTFDDAYVDEWFAALPLFVRYDARVTFYLSYARRLDVRGINLMQHLTVMGGHEVGYHSVEHLNAVKTVQQVGIDTYVSREIIPGVEAMISFGFTPKAFAYPYNARTPEIDAALLNHFTTLRTNCEDVRDALHPFTGNKLLRGKSVDLFFPDGKPMRSIDEVLSYLDLAAETGRVLVLYGHGISDAPVHHNYITWDGLEAILAKANDLDLRFMRASELV